MVQALCDRCKEIKNLDNLNKVNIIFSPESEFETVYYKHFCKKCKHNLIDWINEEINTEDDILNGFR